MEVSCGNTGVASRKEEEATVEGGMRLHWWQSMGEGTRRQQDDRGGGFLAMWEWRQELFLWCACTWRWAQDSGACACACCDHICTAERLFSAAV